MKEKFSISGMTCSACSSRVEKSVSKLEGIGTVSVNLLTNSMQVEYPDGALSHSGADLLVLDGVLYGSTNAPKRDDCRLEGCHGRNA